MNNPHRVSIGTRTDIFLIRNFLSPEECALLIQKSEDRGYEEAAISTPLGQVVAKDVRNNDRILWDDAVLAAEWWERCKDFVPSTFGNWHAYGLLTRQLNTLLSMYSEPTGG